VPIVEAQLRRRLRELGRIRIGQKVTGDNGKSRPAKLDHFRVTSGSRVLLENVAALYGGEVRELADMMADMAPSRPSRHARRSMLSVLESTANSPRRPGIGGLDPPTCFFSRFES
jgi:hypothetical protein